MKKTLPIVIAVIVAIGVAAHYADKATRLHGRATILKADSGVGTLLPDVALKDLGGKDLTLSHYRGKVVLLNFWATWCEPCRSEIPDLIALQQKYGAKGFTVLGVDVDDEGPSAVTTFIDKERFDVNGAKAPINYPTVVGTDTVSEKLGGLFGYPTTILIGKDGKELRRQVGPIDYDQIAKLIESNL